MAWATCIKCGKESHWRATRGSKLGDLRCACGGVLASATAGRPSALRGRVRASCVLCGRPTYRATDEAWQLWDDPVGTNRPSGQPVCRRCSPLRVGSVPWGSHARMRLLTAEDKARTLQEA